MVVQSFFLFPNKNVRVRILGFPFVRDIQIHNYILTEWQKLVIFPTKDCQAEIEVRVENVSDSPFLVLIPIELSKLKLVELH